MPSFSFPPHLAIISRGIWGLRYILWLLVLLGFRRYWGIQYSKGWLDVAVDALCCTVSLVTFVLFSALWTSEDNVK